MMSTSTAAGSVQEGPTRRERVLRVCSEYEQRLKDLTFNCRPVIEELTRKASEHIAYAPDIVRVVGERLRAVRVAPLAEDTSDCAHWTHVLSPYLSHTHTHLRLKRPPSCQRCI